MNQTVKTVMVFGMLRRIADGAHERCQTASSEGVLKFLGYVPKGQA